MFDHRRIEAVHTDRAHEAAGLQLGKRCEKIVGEFRDARPVELQQGKPLETEIAQAPLRALLVASRARLRGLSVAACRRPSAVHQLPVVAGDLGDSPGEIQTFQRHLGRGRALAVRGGTEALGHAVEHRELRQLGQ